LPHEKVLELIHLLDLEGVDIGFFGNRSHIRPEVVREDVALWAGILGERLARTQVELADLYYQPWSDFPTMAPNNPDPKQQADSDALFLTVLEFGRRLKTPGITMLPGVRFGDESDEASIRRSAEKLKQRVAQAKDLGMELSVEGHVGSNVDTPDKLGRLVELTPGLTLTLDYTHYTFAGFSDTDIEPLMKHAAPFSDPRRGERKATSQLQREHHRSRPHGEEDEGDRLRSLDRPGVRLGQLAGLQPIRKCLRDDPAPRPGASGLGRANVPAGRPDGLSWTI
jgi:hypothetical protein